MTELEPVKPEAIKEEIVIPKKTESIRFTSKRLPRGMTQWEFNLETHVGTKVIPKSTEMAQTDLGIQLRHHIEYRKDRYYCMAINLKNAEKKYMKWLAINERLRLLMTIKNAASPTAG